MMAQEKLKVYLAGPMQHGHNGIEVADWRKEIMRRASTPRTWAYPEQIEQAWDAAHGYATVNIPAECLSMIAGSDVVLALLDAPGRIGTYCELAHAETLGKILYVAALQADITTIVVPWFIDQLIVDIAYLPTVEQCITHLINCVGGEKVNYRDYIASPEWKEKADAAKVRAGQRCQVCNKSREQVQLDAHHRTYERLGNELPEDITVLCRTCHGKFHNKN